MPMRAYAGSRRGTRPHEARAALKRVVSEGLRASEVIRGIRSMFQKDDRANAPQDVNELVREVLTLVRGEVVNQCVSVHTELFDELPQIPANRVQLQQVILNLTRNAVDAMSTVANRARILRVKTGLHEFDHLLIAVEDSGTGIEPQNIDRMMRSLRRNPMAWAWGCRSAGRS
jgi:C4-dicarboxylate-specific signal transduction histidine kinase